MDSTRLDWNLLLPLSHLLETASVSAAAKRMGISQPAMSRTLSRLRRAFEDPLLVSVGRRMERSPRARELHGRVRAAVSGIGQLLETGPELPPDRQRFTAHLASSDYAVVVILRPWIASLAQDAPGVDVRIEPVDRGSVQRLARGELDLAIAPFVPVQGLEELVARPILEDRFVCALRQGHPAARGRLTPTRYLALHHVMVGNDSPGLSPVQAELARHAKTRRVAVVVPTFLAALELVAGSDLAVAMPERLVRASGLALDVRPLPFKATLPRLYLFWHPRSTTDPRHRWLREQVMRRAP